ncbi:hypothetical protein LOD99_5613 [Oopsacas minuta]|uniref:Uncharacterized protein n=1 Tax=Oopsacas minuta TaxID=111878 RepID=A0AAV7JQB3_9METZ|nr:hypothetical protein LOD99_5613 [Oopsacas minuta]
MAERYPEIEVPLVMDPTEARINQTFDRLVLCLTNRRVQLITEFRQRQEDRRTAKTNSITTLEELQNLIKEIETKMGQLEAAVKETEVLYECNTQELEEAISGLGKLVERDIIPTPNYSALLQPSISVGKLGYVRRIAYDETSQHIYIAAAFISGSIHIFPIAGEHFDTFLRDMLVHHQE